MKKQKNGLAAFVLSLALAHTTFAGVIHGPNQEPPPPEGPQMCEDITEPAEELDATASLTAYALELLQTLVAIL
ncbi:MAG TPA: hypothetical protein VFX96_05000 [Pyrinomonadaceae bacterium]|nr:hypothetical protein [Pyrinomonadaceae bacterium]